MFASYFYDIIITVNYWMNKNFTLLLKCINLFFAFRINATVMYEDKNEWRNRYIALYDVEPPKNYSRWIEFALSNKCPLDPGAYPQIYKDISKYRAGNVSLISKIMVKMLYNHTNLGFLLTSNGGWVHGGNWQVYHGADVYLDILRKLPSFLPDGLVIFLHTLDEPYFIPADDCNIEKQLKLQCKSYENSYSNIFLRNSCMREHFNYTRNYHGNLYKPISFVIEPYLAPVFHDAVLECSSDIAIPGRFRYEYLKYSRVLVDKIEWKDKKSKLFWRGSNHGSGNLTEEEMKIWSHRGRLVQLSKEFNANNTKNYKFAIDACFVTDRGCSKISIIQHFYYKYLIIVDGYSASGRVFAHMAGKSLIFYASIYSSFTTGIWKPWEHYIPVNANYSDLIEKLVWATHHDQEAQAIAEASHQVYLYRFERNGVECYSALLLLEYANLFPTSMLHYNHSLDLLS